MLQITFVPLINSLPADIICDSFDLVVVQWNRETQTLRRACGAQKAFSVFACMLENTINEHERALRVVTKHQHCVECSP